MSISTNGQVLAAKTKELLILWEHTKSSWNDAKSQEFEQRYLQELAASVDRAVSVLGQLEKVLIRVKHECE